VSRQNYTGIYRRIGDHWETPGGLSP